ncbi:MAG: DUF3299 domain-containing protein [Betaproteobacteria bacterium]|nr:MAG: DUF3299 domain-containing protein [Betaproteobacteria bacterium]
MTPRNFSSLLICTILSCAVWTAQAAQPREMGWDDLVPASVAFDDPFAALSPDHLYLLATVASVRDAQAAGNEVSALTLEEAKDALAELEAEDIDVDGLLARRAEIAEKRRKQAMSTNNEIEGTLIRMPGYVLPLEYDGQKVTEFLLVPFVGACIHTPPPPPNQIVHVLLDESNAFESKGVYEPVWVTGRISSKATTHNLYVQDGYGDFQIAYRLQAEVVERYEQ